MDPPGCPFASATAASPAGRFGKRICLPPRPLAAGASQRAHPPSCARRRVCVQFRAPPRSPPSRSTNASNHGERRRRDLPAASSSSAGPGLSSRPHHGRPTFLDPILARPCARATSVCRQCRRLRRRPLAATTLSAHFRCCRTPSASL